MNKSLTATLNTIHIRLFTDATVVMILLEIQRDFAYQLYNGQMKRQNAFVKLILFLILFSTSWFDFLSTKKNTQKLGYVHG